MWTPDPSDIITADVKAAEAQAAMLAAFENAIQTHVDTTAGERGYKDGFALAGYAVDAEPNEQWRAEACAFVAWRSAVWTYVYAEMAKAMAGERDVPEIETFIGELPVMEWPEEGEQT